MAPKQAQLSQPEPKKQQLSEPDAYDKYPVEFVKSFQRTLENRKVKDALITILNEAFLDHMKSLEAQVLADQQRIDKLQTEHSEVKAEKTTLERDLQHLQQYTRRNALRIYNPSWIEPRNLQKMNKRTLRSSFWNWPESLGCNKHPGK